MADENVCYLTEKDGEEKAESKELEATGEVPIGIGRQSCQPTDMKLALQDALEKAQTKCDEMYDCVGEKCGEEQICLMGVKVTKTRTVGFVKDEGDMEGKCKIKIKFLCECRCIEPPISFSAPRNADDNNSDSDGWDYWDWGRYRIG